MLSTKYNYMDIILNVSVLLVFLKRNEFLAFLKGNDFSKTAPWGMITFALKWGKDYYIFGEAFACVDQWFFLRIHTGVPNHNKSSLVLKN